MMVAMRGTWILLCIAALAAGGCKVCWNACAKDQGRAVTAVMPAPDGTITVTTCTLTTKGKSAATRNCRDHTLPAP